MTDREKLIALAKEGDCSSLTYGECSRCKYGCKGDCSYQFLADHLLANGVTFATDNNVGGKWIPVTERLPGTEKVLITDGEIVMRGYRRPDGVWKYGMELHEVWKKLSLKRVTHWMPLPEPPMRKEKNDGTAL